MTEIDFEPLKQVDFLKCYECLRDGGLFTTECTEAAFAGTEGDCGRDPKRLFNR